MNENRHWGRNNKNEFLIFCTSWSICHCIYQNGSDQGIRPDCNDTWSVMLVFNCYLTHEVYMLYKHQAASLLALMGASEQVTWNWFAWTAFLFLCYQYSINEIKQEMTN